MITDADAEKLAIAISKSLQQARSVSDSEHYDHHRWITTKIKREEEQRKFWQEMRTHVSRMGAWSLITGVGYAAYLGAKQILLSK